MKELIEFSFNGQKALKTVIEESQYGTLEQAVASLAAFAHPDTVRATNSRHLFCVVRTRDITTRGSIVELDCNLKALHDDNLTPTNAFIWAHGILRGHYKDVQFNHAWAQSADIYTYSCLANIFMLHAFLSKLTDTHPQVKAFIRYRCYELYRYHPRGTPTPVLPDAYRELQWANPLVPVTDLETRYRRAMRSSPRSRTTVSAREIGWYYSGYNPDPSV